MSLPILHGCCMIQVYKKVGGHNFSSGGIVYAVCANTLVSAAWFSVLNQERWLLLKRRKSSYVGKHVDVIGKRTAVLMAREILGLPRGAGWGSDKGDHKNHDTLDNTTGNLRVATPTQSQRNRGQQANASSRFKGVFKRRYGFESTIQYSRKQLCLGVFKTDIEAALAFFYAGTLVYREFFYGSEIPADEMPSEERQEEIWQSVLGKVSNLI